MDPLRPHCGLPRHYSQDFPRRRRASNRLFSIQWHRICLYVQSDPMARGNIHEGESQRQRYVEAQKGRNVRTFRCLHYHFLSYSHLGCRPETMGAVCAVVYLLTIITFIPFPFYKDIVAATSGGGNRELVLERQEIENGRVLHRFPHSKVKIRLLSLISGRTNTCSSSWPHISLRFCRCSQLCFLALVTTYSTSDGGISSLSRLLLPSPCW